MAKPKDEKALARAAARRQAIVDGRLDFSRGVTLPADLPDYVDAQDPEGAPVDLTAERVKYLAQLQIRGLWNRGDADTLARKWGVSRQRIHQLSNEADRFVRIYSASDQTEVLLELNSMAREAFDKAMASGQFMAASSLLRVMADMSVDKRPQRTTVTHEVRQLSDSELEKRKAILTAKLVASLPPEERTRMLSEAEEIVVTPEPVPEAPVTKPVLEDSTDEENSDSDPDEPGPIH